MPHLRTLAKKLVNRILNRNQETKPSTAYNMWASTYDDQPDNPILFLDEILVGDLLEKMDLKSKTIVDIGCGTGRHWEKIGRKQPAELIGYEASTEMLNKIRQKYPKAKTYLHVNNTLKELKDGSCDAIISTLVIAHIKDLPALFAEWNRVLKKNGEVILTDFHPVALQRGANRSFMHKGKLIFIKNYIHPLDKVISLASQMNWAELSLGEAKIDERVKPIFERLNVMEAYDQSYGQLILYALRFTKH